MVSLVAFSGLCATNHPKPYIMTCLQKATTPWRSSQYDGSKILDYASGGLLVCRAFHTTAPDAACTFDEVARPTTPDRH
jgi:hypothetical protein